MKDGSPLGEPGSLGVVCSSALLQAIEASAPGLNIVSSRKGLKTGVDLDTRENTLCFKDIDERLALLALLEQSLLVQNSTRDVLSKAWGRKEKATVGLSGLFAVLHADALKALADGLGGLVNGKDTFAGGGDGSGSLGKLLL